VPKRPDDADKKGRPKLAEREQPGKQVPTPSVLLTEGETAPMVTPLIKLDKYTVHIGAWVPGMKRPHPVRTSTIVTSIAGVIAANA
jgi:hypothetical protein